MPIAGVGWELHVVRQNVQQRRGRVRTIGTYQIYHNGNAQNIKGTSVEAKGIGDNKVAGNGRRIQAGTYPLATQAGSHYVTIGYLISNDCDQTPKPGLELQQTGNRREILVHPGHGFLASIGCINLTSALASANTDISFVDSRDRVIAAITDLQTFAGSTFPHHNGQPIDNAWVVIDREP
ncbi:hypothetical protein EN866_34050 [Mesorhizobium sp. M2D.F.Ca.ET.223.01.1.1]|uniref:hypothetical protein n=1 Tax=Mesorhizobium sp. M2D.F.Ca.ET.223.01.1.1 TaxID=2563940 RepID=UPI001092032D|nr:hypothetical protein [Mesorhizobium sp. M2D.F.Ca.ET.223.01.1.1]TGR83572.1 hypothetical protein EN866_34050 [Mesorhizobium sp. M2D.F.Ca.ET.223.01.1.1]TGT75997.1 hypothetical protein EN802_07175 [bacterium M00.F.Ca.ET.159.01.1.1]TGT85058.1 hypothetical protein EN800_13905 [bacterium M00.F.Ca.ET.157.01.1.1]